MKNTLENAVIQHTNVIPFRETLAMIMIMVITTHAYSPNIYHSALGMIICSIVYRIIANIVGMLHNKGYINQTQRDIVHMCLSITWVCIIQIVCGKEANAWIFHMINVVVGCIRFGIGHPSLVIYSIILKVIVATCVMTGMGYHWLYILQVLAIMIFAALTCFRVTRFYNRLLEIQKQFIEIQQYEELAIRYESLYSNAPVAFLSVCANDENFIIKSHNRRAAELTGLKLEEGKFIEIFDSKCRDLVVKTLKKASTLGVCFLFLLLTIIETRCRK
jgi:PAS domain-containing protein